MRIKLPISRARRCVLFLAAALLAFAPAHTVARQQTEGSSAKDDDTGNRVRLVTSLKSPDALRFQLGERLQTKVPSKNKDSVGAVLLKRDDSLTDTPATVDATTLFQQGKLYLEIESRMIERLLYQPLEIKVDQKQLNRIVYIPVANSKTENEPSSFRPNWYLRLNSRTPLAAIVNEDANLKIDSEIGTVDAALKTIAAIRFSKDANAASTFVFKNGDKITGTGKLAPQIKIKTKWGDAELDTTRILSMTREEKTTFIQGTGSMSKQFFLNKPTVVPQSR